LPILNERYVWQSRAAEPRPQLEAILERLLIIILIRRVFNDNCVVSLANFVPLLGLDLPFFWDLDQLRRRRQLEDKLRQVILREAQLISATTLT
jgi:hypothetical protein